MQCQNNCKQIGLAIVNYESLNGYLPPGATTTTAKPPLPAQIHGWAVFVLPNLEQGNAVAGYDYTKPWDDDSTTPVSNAKIGRLPMKVMMCPSSPAPKTVTSTTTTNGMYVGDYKPPVRVSNTGSPSFAGPGGLLSPGVQLVTPANNGIMQTNVLTKYAQILDGSSNTIMIAESAGSSNEYRQGKVFSTTAPAGAPWSDRNAVMAPAGYDPAKATMASTRPGLVVINGSNDSEVYAFHSGGANVVFADGHIAFLNSSIAPATFVALITYQAGDIPGNY